MRFAAAAGLVVAGAALAAFHRAMPAPHGPSSVWALFSFAVAAFRGPLR